MSTVCWGSESCLRCGQLPEVWSARALMNVPAKLGAIGASCSDRRRL